MGKLTSMRGVWLKSLLALSMALPLQVGLWHGNAAVHAEGPTDPAPFIQAKVVNENAGKRYCSITRMVRQPELQTGLLMADSRTSVMHWQMTGTT